MITLFALPKPFEGHSGVIQHNALASWCRIPDAQVIVLGDDAGVAEAAEEHGAEHIPNIAKNSFGTFVLDDAFAQAQRHAKHQTVIYTNADIIFFPDVAEQLVRVPFEQYLTIGRRTDLDITDRLDFEKDWQGRLLDTVAEQKSEPNPSAIDYFAFPKEQPSGLPPFPVGRAMWDNWMVYNARRCGRPIVDATEAITAIHQNHGYGHLKGGKKESHSGPEVKANAKLVDDDFYPLILRDANWRMDRETCERFLDVDHLIRRVASTGRMSSRWRPLLETLDQSGLTGAVRRVAQLVRR